MFIHTNTVTQDTTKAELKVSTIIYILHLKTLYSLNIFMVLYSTISPHKSISAF